MEDSKFFYTDSVLCLYVIFPIIWQILQEAVLDLVLSICTFSINSYDALVSFTFISYRVFSSRLINLMIGSENNWPLYVAEPISLLISRRHFNLEIFKLIHTNFLTHIISLLIYVIYSSNLVCCFQFCSKNRIIKINSKIK